MSPANNKQMKNGFVMLFMLGENWFMSTGIMTAGWCDVIHDVLIAFHTIECPFCSPVIFAETKRRMVRIANTAKPTVGS